MEMLLVGPDDIYGIRGLTCHLIWGQLDLWIRGMDPKWVLFQTRDIPSRNEWNHSELYR